MCSRLSPGIELAERGLVPDLLMRHFIRHLCARRFRDLAQTTKSDRQAAGGRFVDSLRSGPIALVPEKANQQHYELPTEFFTTLLGPNRKYSCCYFPDRDSSLEEAEAAALQLTCEHAELDDGQNILELGCGWGSLSLWMAERFRNSQIAAVSNSTSQRQFIETEARARKITNLQVTTADINEFSPPNGRFDRIVSVEMFEHMRNFEELLRRAAGWLKPRGKLFVHHFCHREHSYPFETEGSENWMGRYFFTGGLMPSAELLSWFDRDFAVSRRWIWSGRHYQRTADAWLENLDRQSNAALRILNAAYGSEHAFRWLQRWRMFLLAVSELFGYASGGEWFVVHCLLEPMSLAQRAEDRSCRLSF